MNEDYLKERLVYFEQRLADAERMSAAKERLPANFSAGFTTEKPKTWPETIKLMKERITGIKAQLNLK
jgi:hypothetical protein